MNHRDALLDFHGVLIHYFADVLKADGIIPQDKPMLVKRQADPENIKISRRRFPVQHKRQEEGGSYQERR